jgi:hypothetical protein
MIELKQSDFDNGTFRITDKGYYKLTEDIVFNPNPSIWDGDKLVGDNWMPRQDQKEEYPSAPLGPYHMGFFAALSVEVDDVIIDLNGYTMEQSMEHYLQQRFFSVIELASSPFISGQGPSNFGEQVSFPSHVKIMNGNIGRSSHQGIHGNNMKHILLENLNIYNYEQAGIALNGGEYIYVKNVIVGNSSRNVVVNATYSQSRFMVPFLRKIIEEKGNPQMNIMGSLKSGTDLLDEMTLEMDSVYRDIFIDKVSVSSDLYRNDEMVIDGNIYGIIFNAKGVAVHNFLETRDNIVGNKNIVLEDVIISNLDSVPKEVLGLPISEVDTEIQTYGSPTQKGPVGDVFRITEVRDDNGYYIQNIHANVQCYISKFNGGGTSNIEADIYDNWIVGAVLPDDELYFNHSQDSMAHFMKGTIGLFLSGVENIDLYNTKIHHIKNRGLVGHKPDEYLGNVCRGVCIVSCKDVSIKDINIHKIISENGDSVGIEYIHPSNDVDISMCHIDDILSGNYSHSYIIKGTENVVDMNFTRNI